jgi:hypothetical protein
MKTRMIEGKHPVSSLETKELHRGEIGVLAEFTLGLLG